MSDKPIAAGKSSFDLINVPKAFSIIDIQPGSTFVDLACGVGRYSLEVAENMGATVKVYAVDLWEEGLKILDQEIMAKGISNIEPVFADIRSQMPFAAGSIDSCLLATILHDLSESDRKSTVREVGRILDYGGSLNIIEFKKVNRGPGPPIDKRLGEKDVERLVEQYRFVRVGVAELGEYVYLVKYIREE